MPVARIYLSLLLGAMALGQLVSLPVFLDAVESYGAVPSSLVVPFALGVIGAEAAASAGLWIGRWRVPAARLGLVVAAGWTVLAVQAFGRGLVVENCGCFGSFLPQELRWWVLVEDAYFVFLGWWVLRGEVRSRLPDTGPASRQAPSSPVSEGAP